MFTGLIEAVGTVASTRSRGGSARLTIATPWSGSDLVLGESVAVDGACLTVADRDGAKLGFDVVAETLARTTLGDAKPGRRVNLERALRADARLGGHFVQGHVDAVGTVLKVVRRAGDWRLGVRFTPAIRRFVALKGSITLNGVSLTVAVRDRNGFEVALVPETLARTNLGELRPGARVHVEVDLIARYLDVLLRSGKGE